MIDTDIKKLKTLVGKIDRIAVKEITLTEPFMDFAARFAHIPGTVVLMSGGGSDCAKYHFLATLPWLSLICKNRAVTVNIDKREYGFKSDPFAILQSLLNDLKLNQTQLPKDAPFPISAGLFGYLSYDLKDFLEFLPRTTIDDLHLPHMCFYAPSIMVVAENKTGRSYLVTSKRRLPDGTTLNADMNLFNKISRMTNPDPTPFKGSSQGLCSNFDKQDYTRSIEMIQEYIAAGHVYQVNMSQRFEMEFKGDPFFLFKTLFNKNPAPFFAFIQADDHQIVSTSPERFIKRTGNQLETRPIKGTRPRGLSEEKDKQLKQELENSKKDNAELSMIVDLLRNDMGKVCTAGSVHVKEHKRIETYENVYHLVSIVEGDLDKQYDSVDLIKATFPGGSITGCPKIRSMEIIDELESHRRHIYTGAIGYIGFHDTLDLSIAIRTATITNNRIVFSAGGGIVYDSIPNEEYEETLHKGKTLMDALETKPCQTRKTTTAWFNGVIKPLNDICIPVSDLGFQYGYGFFETIRIHDLRVQLLTSHIDRFNTAWKQLFNQQPPDLSWDVIIKQVAERNDLAGKVGAVKIIATKGGSSDPCVKNNLIVTCRPYTHRLFQKKESGLNMVTFPEPRMTPLADHKTLNYLYYHLAGKWAGDRGADEALIINPDHTVSETNTGNILMIKDNTVIRPASPHVLPGTMEKAICDLLEKWGYEARQKKMTTTDLLEAELVLVTNSLMGAVPILSIDNRKLSSPPNLFKKINNKILQTENWCA